MTEESRGSVRVAKLTHYGPPPNELPVLVDPGLVTWRSEVLALSVPYLLVYTTGAEFALLGRSRSSWADPVALAREVEHGFNGHGRGGGFSFRSPGIVGLGSDFRDDGIFRCLGWIPTPAVGDVLMSLKWPSLGIAYAEHRIAGEHIRQATQRALILWP